MKKNPTILKDELGLLKADKSAVIIEIRSLGAILKESQEEVELEEKALLDIKNKIIKETARRDDMNARVVFLSGEESRLKQEVNTLAQKSEQSHTKNSQEQKLHLGRIRELNQEEKDLLESIDNLKKIYETNVNAMNSNISELTSKHSTLKTIVTNKHKELQETTTTTTKLRNEEKRITKDRLKREDKIRAREKVLKRKERGFMKREEDVETMASDLVIVYFRLKELYAKVDPSVDIDKLIITKS